VQEIGIALHEKFPDTDPLGVRFTDLHKWVRELPGFADEPEQVEREDPRSHPDGLAGRARMKTRAAYKALKKKASACPGRVGRPSLGRDRLQGRQEGLRLPRRRFRRRQLRRLVQVCRTRVKPRSRCFSWATSRPATASARAAGSAAHFEKKDDVPVGLLEQWIDESYAAVAPKRRGQERLEGHSLRFPSVRRTLGEGVPHRLLVSGERADDEHVDLDAVVDACPRPAG